MKVLVHTPIDQFSGYGRDGIGLLRGLLDLHHDVRLVPTYVSVPLPRDIAGLLTYPYDPPFDIAIHHIPLETATLPPTDAAVSRRNILWSMWGWEQLPDEPWVPGLRENIENYDTVAVYDQNTKNSLAGHADSDRLKMVLGGYEADDWKPAEFPRPDGPFRFGMAGKLTVRKGVYTAYRAFNLLKERHGDAFDAVLVLNSTEPVFPPTTEVAEGVYIKQARSLPEAMREFYWSLDTLLAPSYAEAKHLPPIEALACGVPVILSDIPGHRMWATSNMVTWAPTTTKTILPGFTGGEVSTEALADAMWMHYNDRAAQKRKAESAARSLPAMLDWSKCLQRLGNAAGVLL